MGHRRSGPKSDSAGGSPTTQLLLTPDYDAGTLNSSGWTGSLLLYLFRYDADADNWEQIDNDTSTSPYTWHDDPDLLRRYCFALTPTISDPGPPNSNAVQWDPP